MEAIILAGGLGTRLRSRLIDLPKSMAMVAGRPFLAILMDQMVKSGITRILLSVGYRRGVIQEHFRAEYKGIPLEYIAEQEPLGTGGAIRVALSHGMESATLILNGDTYLDLDCKKIFSQHVRSGRAMTMAVTEVKDMARYGGVLMDGDRVVGFIEKGQQGPGWINAGAYVLRRDFPWPAGLARTFSFENDVLVPFVSELQPAAVRSVGRFLDIGIPEDLDRAQTELAIPDSREG